MDSSDDGALAGLVLIFVAIVAVLYVISIIVYAIVIAVAIAAAIGIGLAVFAGVGVLANLGLRSLVGLSGDLVGATPQTGRIALGVVLLAPPGLMLGWLLAMLAAQVVNTIAIGIWFGALCISVPVYYWGYWENQIPRIELDRAGAAIGPIPLDVPFKTDAVMRAEEQLLLTQAKSWIVVQEVRVKLLFLRTRADLEALPVWRWIERS